MGKRLIIIMEEKDGGAHFSFKFVPPTTKDEQSSRIYYTMKFMQTLKEENGDSLDIFEVVGEEE